MYLGVCVEGGGGGGAWSGILNCEDIFIFACNIL